jgi:aminopeptidase N
VVQKNAGTDPALKQLRQELDEVKKANQDLRGRLEALEAKNNKPEKQSS